MAEERRTPAPGTNPTPGPAWAFKIATVAGIPIRVHFTFLLFLIWIAFGVRGGPDSLRVVYVLSVFLCVLLHELGHSIVALRYNIPVADITLYPIGGVARIEKRPTAKQELWIALAGPAVNVVIAALLWAALGFPGPDKIIPDLTSASSAAAVRKLIEQVMLTNVTLVLFNMIPAFPMDGGRVLRAILALNVGPQRATAMAAGIGQLIAIVAGLWAVLSGNWFYMFIALFVYIGAGQEAFVYSQAALLEGVSVAKAMMTDVRTLTVGSTLKEAADLLLATSQQDFPVLHGDSVEGVLTRDGLLRGLAAEGPGAYVAGVMARQFQIVAPGQSLAESLPELENGPLIVLDPANGNRLLGMVTAENVSEYFAVTRIVAARAQAQGSQGER
ncbi:protease [Capsulimonas corticalis]|uniref:Zinc metalloprotease n=1 Tax=Capsulimonas corticalis TaxID=2219043 RepID=A0A402D4W3_9BACT|nr:site-2 protease family protein [Capsulimonas corticalis]BDI31996.1 protease [Capsulimonas corticalis]